MSNINNIKLGNRVRDMITGYTGIVTSKVEYLNGNTQFTLTPEAKDDKYPESITLDYHTLEVMDKAFEDKVTEPTFNSGVKLGNNVECLVSGFRGIASNKCTYMNGCSSFLVTHNFVNTQTGQRQMVEDWVDQVKLKVVDNGVAEKVKKSPVTKEGKAPGGAPMRGVPRG